MKSSEGARRLGDGILVAEVLCISETRLSSMLRRVHGVMVSMQSPLIDDPRFVISLFRTFHVYPLTIIFDEGLEDESAFGRYMLFQIADAP